VQRAKVLFYAAERAASAKGVTVVVCPPFPYLEPLRRLSKNAALGAQDCSWQQEGALTGEVSPRQLKSVGCSFVILGHSERKRFLKETLATVQRKATAALEAGLRVILCAESAKELRAHKRKLGSFRNVLVVFEPSSAISTQGGRRVPPERIAKTAAAFRKIAGRGVPVLYGGSVEAAGIGKILSQGGVQGVLVGAVSLDSREFARLVKSAKAR
ncbi:MAG: triose-phosphate isomerase family protein, partial [bacterium]|nr:triose-phosphate isomerase family protein [bacterium]